MPVMDVESMRTSNRSSKSIEYALAVCMSMGLASSARAEPEPPATPDPKAEPPATPTLKVNNGTSRDGKLHPDDRLSVDPAAVVTVTRRDEPEGEGEVIDSVRVDGQGQVCLPRDVDFDEGSELAFSVDGGEIGTLVWSKVPRRYGFRVRTHRGKPSENKDPQEHLFRKLARRDTIIITPPKDGDPIRYRLTGPDGFVEEGTTLQITIRDETPRGKLKLEVYRDDGCGPALIREGFDVVDSRGTGPKIRGWAQWSGWPQRMSRSKNWVQVTVTKGKAAATAKATFEYTGDTTVDEKDEKDAAAKATRRAERKVIRRANRRLPGKRNSDTTEGNAETKTEETETWIRIRTSGLPPYWVTKADEHGHYTNAKERGRLTDLEHIEFPALRLRDTLFIAASDAMSKVTVRAEGVTVIEHTVTDTVDCPALPKKPRQECVAVPLRKYHKNFRPIEHGTPLEIEVEFEDWKRRDNKKLRTIKRKSLSLYGIETKRVPAMGFWVPLALFSTNFKKSQKENGIPIATQPIGLALGGKWHLRPRFYLGLSGILSWTIHSATRDNTTSFEVYPGGASSVEPSASFGGGSVDFNDGNSLDTNKPRFVVNSMTPGVLLDINNYLGLGFGWVLDFTDNQTQQLGPVLLFGASPDLLNLLKGSQS